MSDSAQPHRWQPTRLPRPWGSPGKNTGVGCHFLLQCRKVKSESEVAQSCLTLSMDCSLPGSSVHGIFQARVLEWGAIVFSILLPRGFQKERQKLTWEKKSNNLSPRKCQKRKANYIYCHISKPSLIQDEIIFYTTPHKQEMGGSV